jgi:hypothetical protein
MAISDQNRRVFEGAGLGPIKLELATGGIRFFGINPEMRAQAEEWVKETEAAIKHEHHTTRSLERSRFNTILIWTVIAATASVIAAVTGVLALFKK